MTDADAVSLHRRLAYVLGDVYLWPNLTGGVAIDLLGALRGGLDRRRTVLLSSHILAEVEALCDRVSIIREGRVVETGTFKVETGAMGGVVRALASVDVQSLTSTPPTLS